MLHFEIDAANLQQMILDLAATEKQVKLALHRALARTATTLRTMSSRRLKDELALRIISLLRKRLKSLKLRVSGGDGFTLWFGLNNMPVSWFKGTPKESGAGAEFRGQSFPGAFVAKSKSKGRQTVLKRVGSARVPVAEQLLAIGDKAQVVIEDQIFVQAEQVFWKHFERDLKARVNYQLGSA